MSSPVRKLGVRVLAVAQDHDLFEARAVSREMASVAGFEGADLVLIAAAVSEITRNILMYAGSGEINVSLLQQGGRRGVEIIAVDRGPGISDVGRLLSDQRSGVKGSGLGMQGARRVMDEFRVDSEPGRGTVVTMRKWLS